MRGADERQSSMFSFVSMEERVPADHPLRPILAMTNEALEAIRPRLDRMYAKTGRPSIAPEKLLRALLIQMLYTVRSERLLVEQIRYNLLFRWFIGLGMDDEVWHATTFTQNRDRLLGSEVAHHFFQAVLQQAESAKLLSDEHFTVDGTFLEAWASQKSFKAKDGSDGNDPNESGGRNPTVDFRGQKRSNETHASVTDPDARLRRKGGDGAKLVYSGNLVTENRHGLVVAAGVTMAEGNFETEAALDLLGKQRRQRGTVGADKGYDNAQFTEGIRKRGLTPHVAQNDSGNRSSTIDGRTTRHPGYAVSQRRRKMVEEVFGWMKTVGLMRKLRHRGTPLVDWMFEFAAAAYNLVRMRRLMPATAATAVA
jgi:transposase